MSKSEKQTKTEIMNVQIQTDNPVRICGILDHLNFDDSVQVALLLWPDVCKRKVGLHEAAYMANMQVDELRDLYLHTDLSDYLITKAELEQEQKNIDEVLKKRGVK